MTNIPPEIWLDIASFIPNEVIYGQLLSVNRVFLHLGLNIQWGKVRIVWESRRPNSLRIPERLRDPFIAKRVERLDLVLNFNNENFKFQMPKQHDEQMAQRVAPNRLHQTIARAFKPFRSGRQLQGPSKWEPATTSSPFDDSLEAIINCIATLPHVAEFTVDTWIAMDKALPLPNKLDFLFATSWSCFSANLRFLSLEGELPVYQRMALLKPTFNSLKGLQISPSYSPAHLPDGQDGALLQLDDLLLDTLVPFINSVSPQLETLGLKLWGFYDVSDFFKQLSECPALNNLDIHLFGAPLRDPSGLRKFLFHASHTLHKLELYLSSIGDESSQSRQALSELILECASDRACFSRLRSLNIYPTRPIRIDALVASIKQSSRTLTELTISRYLCSPHETEMIVDALSECPDFSCLSLDIKTLNISLLDYLDMKLPGLQRFNIVYGLGRSKIDVFDNWLIRTPN
ncbi:hypothetical protein BDZ97DRAFT_1866047, partial [Flammula alnicola]